MMATVTEMNDDSEDLKMWSSYTVTELNDDSECDAWPRCRGVVRNFNPWVPNI